MPALDLKLTLSTWTATGAAEIDSAIAHALAGDGDLVPSVHALHPRTLDPSPWEPRCSHGDPKSR